MNALINLKDCREYMTITLNNKDHRIKLSGTIDDPYFCGRNVCNILGYKDPKDAIQRYVEKEDKKDLKQLQTFNGSNEPNELGGAPPPNSLGSLEPLNYHEGKTVYINEPGLYSLILSSQAPFAKEFKKLVCKIILPSIRKYGSYQIESKLSKAMDQLALKEKSEEELSAQLALKEKSEEEMKEKLVRAERKAIRVNKFMRRIVVKEHKLEWIYIATNDQYARERLFKIGSTTRLSSRIASYNTGRAKGVDTYYYVWAIKCYNSKDVDNHIQKLLSEFKYGKNQDVSKENRSEMYHGIKFSDLKDIVAFIVNNYDESMDYINNFIKTRLNQSMEEEDDIPPPLNYKKLTYQIGEHTETIDVENEETESIREALEDILSSLKDQEERTISREALLTQLLSVTNASKQSLWSQIKEFTGWKNSKTEIDEGSFRYKIVY
jgi:prophage antirepressor-like protein